MSNKKAQVGDTLTWLVATIIIFVFLLFFILGASLLGKMKSIDSLELDLFGKDDFKIHDAFLTKSIFTYLQFPDSIKGNDLKNKLEDLSVSGNFDEPLGRRLDDLEKRAKI